jgi:hypothetical protein
MSMEVLDPASAKALEEAAKAGSEVAKLGSQVIDAGTSLATYFDRVLGTLPEDLVGLVLGDWLNHVRRRRLVDLWKGTKEHFRKRGVTETVNVSSSVLLPLLRAAQDEDRAVLKDLWAKLLASAMDPNRAEYVRPSLIALLEEMDPLDARVLERMAAGGYAHIGPKDVADQLADSFKVTRDDAYFSLQHLHELGCLEQAPNVDPNPRLSAKARLLLRAVS